MSHYAFIKNNVVTNVIVGNALSDDFLSSIKEEQSVDDVVLTPEDFFVGIGYTYLDKEFRPPVIFPSWIWDKTTKSWEAPIEHPTDGKIYNWDESSTSWIEVTE